jgi:preprotein translocase subunit SecD
MQNRYPLWKYLLIVLVLALGFIYAIPNLYSPDPAIQISGESSGMVIDSQVLEKAEAALKSAGIEYFGAQVDARAALLRFKSDEQQLLAKRAIQDALGGSYVVALNLAPTTPKWLRSMGAEPMKLGLDLRGGVHFLMEVDTASAVSKRQEVTADEIKEKLRKARIRYASVAINTQGAIVGRFRTQELRDQAISEVRRDYPDLVFVANEATTGQEEFRFTASLSETSVRTLEDEALSQNLITLRNRVNELGVAEPVVQRQGRNRIIVQLPGIQDTAEAKRIIGKTANLEFRLEAKPDALISAKESFPWRNEMDQARFGNQFLERQLILSGDHVNGASSSLDPETNIPQVNINLDSAGGTKMNLATRYNIGRRMGILFIEYKTRLEEGQDENGERVMKPVQYVESKIINLATIQSALGVQFRITGLESMAEASELALLLRAGALAAPMYIVEERTIGPSLGAENIAVGMTAVKWGMGAVLLFMLFYYRAFGLVANIALVCNVILIVSVMSLLGATLTLPGIAGIVLTIGMAVDANVLIFSRMREELRNGAPPQMAIYSGYERAWVTILDANLTTLIVAVILYAVGTGPIRGFAVTLSVGILTSMFTAVMCSRAMINLVYGSRKNLQKLWI